MPVPVFRRTVCTCGKLAAACRAKRSHNLAPFSKISTITVWLTRCLRMPSQFWNRFQAMAQEQESAATAAVACHRAVLLCQVEPSPADLEGLPLRTRQPLASGPPRSESTPRAFACLAYRLSLSMLGLRRLQPSRTLVSLHDGKASPIVRLRRSRLPFLSRLPVRWVCTRPTECRESKVGLKTGCF